ncbi:MAG: RNA methyltransferase [Acidobacteriota bacterium]
MITSRQNRWVQTIRQSQSKRRRGALLLEGPHLIDDAIDAGIALDAILATPEFLTGDIGRRLLPRLPRHPLEIAETLLVEVTDSDSPRGIVALAERRALALHDLPTVSGGIYVLADGVQDPGNLGALARSAEAAGAAGLIAGPGCGALDHPRALRASAGSLLRLPVAESRSLDAVTAHLASLDTVWFGLVPRDGHDVWHALPPAAEDTARVLVVGAEGRGLSTAAARRLDLGLTIPMAGSVESLNATVAASIVLFEWRRRLNRSARTAPGTSSARTSR